MDSEFFVQSVIVETVHSKWLTSRKACWSFVLPLNCYDFMYWTYQKHYSKWNITPRPRLHSSWSKVLRVKVLGITLRSTRSGSQRVRSLPTCMLLLSSNRQWNERKNNLVRNPNQNWCDSLAFVQGRAEVIRYKSDPIQNEFAFVVDKTNSLL